MNAKPISKSQIKIFHKYFIYNGVMLTWRINNWKARAGNEAGCSRGVHRSQVGLDKKRYYASRVIWCMVHGRDVKRGHVIAFRDGNPANMRIENLFEERDAVVVRRYRREADPDQSINIAPNPAGGWFSLYKTRSKHLRVIRSHKSRNMAIKAAASYLKTPPPELATTRKYKKKEA